MSDSIKFVWFGTIPNRLVIILKMLLFCRQNPHDIDTALIESAANRPEPYRVVVLGPEKVGKTALINRFLNKEFPIKHKATTEQTNHSTYSLAGVKIKLEILDTSGKNEVSIERSMYSIQLCNFTQKMP